MGGKRGGNGVVIDSTGLDDFGVRDADRLANLDSIRASSIGNRSSEMEPAEDRFVKAQERLDELRDKILADKLLWRDEVALEEKIDLLDNATRSSFGVIAESYVNVLMPRAEQRFKAAITELRALDSVVAGLRNGELKAMEARGGDQGLGAPVSQAKPKRARRLVAEIPNNSRSYVTNDYKRRMALDKVKAAGKTPVRSAKVDKVEVTTDWRHDLDAWSERFNEVDARRSEALEDIRASVGTGEGDTDSVEAVSQEAEPVIAKAPLYEAAAVSTQADLARMNNLATIASEAQGATQPEMVTEVKVESTALDQVAGFGAAIKAIKQAARRKSFDGPAALIEVQTMEKIVFGLLDDLRNSPDDDFQAEAELGKLLDELQKAQRFVQEKMPVKLAGSKVTSTKLSKLASKASETMVPEDSLVGSDDTEDVVIDPGVVSEASADGQAAEPELVEGVDLPSLSTPTAADTRLKANVRASRAKSRTKSPKVLIADAEGRLVGGEESEPTEDQLVAKKEQRVYSTTDDGELTSVEDLPFMSVAPLPEKEAGVKLVEIEEEPKTVFGRAKKTWSGAMDYIRHGWQRVVDEEIYGELAPQELDPTVKVGKTEKGAHLLAGLLSGVSSTMGLAVIPDAVRYVTQSRAASAEGLQLKQAIKEAARAKSRLFGVDAPEGETAEAKRERLLQGHAERRAELEAKIQKSKRMTPKVKEALLARLALVLSDFEDESAKLKATSDQEIDVGIHAELERLEASTGKFLDAHLTSKVSAAKVGREALNSAIALSAMATGAGTIYMGMHALRGPAYAAGAIFEKYRQQTREFALGERQVEANLKSAVNEGFAEWSKQLALGSSYTDKRKAIGTAVRVLGFGLTGAETVFEGALDRGLGDVAGEALKEATGLEIDQLLEAGVKQAKAALKEVFAQFATPQEINLGETTDWEPVPEVPVLDESPVFRGEIPLGSRIEDILESGEAVVQAKEGITYPLRRVIEANPEAYGFDPDKGLSPSMFAKLKAVEITNRDGQMKQWLTSKAVDKLNLFPELVEGEWHIAAVVEGKKLSLSDLQKLGFISPQPASAK
ncbi:MAG: hypothetical protein WAZ14_02160 [Patescibacteria group bacterium]